MNCQDVADNRLTGTTARAIWTASVGCSYCRQDWVVTIRVASQRFAADVAKNDMQVVRTSGSFCVYESKAQCECHLQMPQPTYIKQGGPAGTLICMLMGTLARPRPPHLRHHCCACNPRPPHPGQSLKDACAPALNHEHSLRGIRGWLSRNPSSTRVMWSIFSI